MGEESGGRLRVYANWPEGFAGRGVERFPNGETYVGDFGDGLREGRGSFIDASGNVLSHRDHTENKRSC